MRDSEGISAGPCLPPAFPSGSKAPGPHPGFLHPAPTFLSGLKGVIPVSYRQVSPAGNGQNKMRKIRRLMGSSVVEHPVDMPWVTPLRSILDKSGWWCRGLLAQRFGDRGRLVFVSSRPRWSIERRPGHPELHSESQSRQNKMKIPENKNKTKTTPDGSDL